ncbi:MAG: hypothetical protein JWQ35_1868 [Bacteriovoracaceae bacterium]|nr:hypothetical protein [Bacteriovoracaceae bacterium]
MEGLWILGRLAPLAVASFNEVLKNPVEISESDVLLLREFSKNLDRANHYSPDVNRNFILRESKLGLTLKIKPTFAERCSGIFSSLVSRFRRN